MSAIKRSVGIASPVENGDGSEVPLRHEDAATGKKQGPIYRCSVDGKTVYADVPCDGPSSKFVETGQSAGVRTADAGKAEKYKARVPAAKITGEPKPVPTGPSSVSAARARCDKLEKFIGFLDDRARQPLSGSELDSIKQEKKIWRREQSDLHCAPA
jgi:hypothetical protein